ncbi:calmodulin-binding protein 60 F-like isoform X2 [Chenopodium quinoa]|uniref:calmodulin-binding protein 60 F-like isoform X2 n=1 Tax=Chenopodium quinoa TaxID=63459 RepID=UPI000B78F986|nr:calmodulin-binding protein 60 F-like isoform X2 [Chenopodium quinoa]
MASGIFSGEEHPHQHFNCCCSGACVTTSMIRSSLEKVNSVITQVHNQLNQLRSLLQNSALSPTTSSLPDHSESSAPGSFRLSFKGIIPNELLTNTNIEKEGTSLKVELLDEFGKRVEVGVDSCVKIKIDVLDGDFNVEEEQNWTEEKFKEKIARPRKGKGSLLKGNTKFSLNGGVADVCGFSFTDISSSMTNGTFRFGAQVIGGLPSGRVVRSAVSEKEFRVKVSRLKSERKRSNPSPEDDLWRLKNINKTGPVCCRAKEKEIHTVKDFLQLYHTDEKKMKAILRVPETKWDEIVKNAEACTLTKEQYRYYDDASGDDLILDCAFNIKRVTFKGGTTQLYKSLDFTQKEKAGKLRQSAYEKRHKLELIVPTQEGLAYPSSAEQQELQEEQEQQPAAAPSPYTYSSNLPMQYPGTAATYQDDLLQNMGVATESACFMAYVSGDNIPNPAVNMPVQISDHSLDSLASLPPELYSGSFLFPNVSTDSGMQQVDNCASQSSLSTSPSFSKFEEFIAGVLAEDEASLGDSQALNNTDELRTETPSRLRVYWRKIGVKLNFIVRIRRIDSYRPLKKQKTGHTDN